MKIKENLGLTWGVTQPVIQTWSLKNMYFPPPIGATIPAWVNNLTNQYYPADQYDIIAGNPVLKIVTTPVVIAPAVPVVIAPIAPTRTISQLEAMNITQQIADYKAKIAEQTQIKNSDIGALGAQVSKLQSTANSLQVNLNNLLIEKEKLTKSINSLIETINSLTNQVRTYANI